MDEITIETWEDLAALLAKMTPEQRKQKVQICQAHPCWDHVHELQQGIAFATIGTLEIAYCRSSVDNRHHDDEFVLYTDMNPFGEDGVVGYEVVGDSPEGLKENPIYPKGHDASADWTGPAQKLRDETRNKLDRPALHQKCSICCASDSIDKIPRE